LKYAVILHKQVKDISIDWKCCFMETVSKNKSNYVKISIMGWNCNIWPPSWILGHRVEVRSDTIWNQEEHIKMYEKRHFYENSISKKGKDTANRQLGLKSLILAAILDFRGHRVHIRKKCCVKSERACQNKSNCQISIISYNNTRFLTKMFLYMPISSEPEATFLIMGGGVAFFSITYTIVDTF